jgi:hypothetical protein
LGTPGVLRGWRLTALAMEHNYGACVYGFLDGQDIWELVETGTTWWDWVDIGNGISWKKGVGTPKRSYFMAWNIQRIPVYCIFHVGGLGH